MDKQQYTDTTVIFTDFEQAYIYLQMLILYLMDYSSPGGGCFASLSETTGDD